MFEQADFKCKDFPVDASKILTHFFIKPIPKVEVGKQDELNDILKNLENSMESGKRWEYSEGESIYNIFLQEEDLPPLQCKTDLEKIKYDQEQHRAILNFIESKDEQKKQISKERKLL